MKYKKKPVVIEAVQFIACEAKEIEECFNEFPKWLHKAFKGGIIDSIFPYIGSQVLFRICTLEGNRELPEGHWLIRGEKGELYPCNDEIFKMTYEEVNKNEK